MKEQNVTAGLKGSKPTNATPDCSLAKCAPESLRSLLTLVIVPSCPIAASGPDVHAQLCPEMLIWSLGSEFFSSGRCSK
jgi:hypothetical protein